MRKTLSILVIVIAVGAGTGYFYLFSGMPVKKAVLLELSEISTGLSQSIDCQQGTLRWRSRTDVCFFTINDARHEKIIEHFSLQSYCDLRPSNCATQGNEDAFDKKLKMDLQWSAFYMTLPDVCGFSGITDLKTFFGQYRFDTYSEVRYGYSESQQKGCLILKIPYG